MKYQVLAQNKSPVTSLLQFVLNLEVSKKSLVLFDNEDLDISHVNYQNKILF